MSDTPRTDAIDNPLDMENEQRLGDFARQLERELNARLSPPAVAQSSTRGREPFAWYTEHDGGGAYFRLTVYEKPTSGDWTPLYLAQSAKEVKPAPDRNDAVNLARNYLGPYQHLTNEGAQRLCEEGPMSERKSSDGTSSLFPEGLPTCEQSIEEVWRVAKLVKETQPQWAHHLENVALAATVELLPLPASTRATNK